MTLAEVLEAAGYATYACGKWHVNEPGPIELLLSAPMIDHIELISPRKLPNHSPTIKSVYLVLIAHKSYRVVWKPLAEVNDENKK